MIFSIYLHKPIAQTLKCFGELSDVVNRILAAGSEGSFDLVDCPPCPSREGATRYNIDVTDETYISLVESFPMNSSRISLRRILYWFVENEFYDVLEWVPVNNYKDEEKVKLLNKISSIYSQLHKLKLKLNSSTEDDALKEVLEKLNNLKEVINYER